MPWVVSASDIGVFRHVVMIKFVTPSSISMMHAAFSINGTVTGDGDAVATMMTSSSSSRTGGVSVHCIRTAATRGVLATATAVWMGTAVTLEAGTTTVSSTMIAVVFLRR